MSEAIAENKNAPKNVIVNKEMNFQTYDNQTPKYEYSNLIPSNVAQNTFTISSTGNNIVEFKIPKTDLNWKKTIVPFKFEIAADQLSAFHIYLDKITLIGSINLSLINGQPLVDYSFTHMFNNPLLLRDTCYEDMIHNDWTNTLRKSEETTLANNKYPYNSTFEAGNIYGKTAGATNEAITLNEPQHVASYARNTAVTLYREICLGDLVDTEFSLDKDTLYPTDAILRLTLNPTYAMAYRNSYTDAGGGNYTDNGLAELDANTNITISNLYLKLAVQTNFILQRSLAASLYEGKLTYSMPFIVPYKFNVNSSLVNLTVSFNSVFARRLRSIIVMFYNSGSRNQNLYNCANYNASRLRSYVSYLNTQRLYAEDIYCYQPTTLTTGKETTDWMVMKNIINGSVILNRAQYQKTWWHQDSFAVEDGRLRCINLDKKNDNGGLDISNLGNSINYQFVGNHNGVQNLDYYIFLVFNRKVTFSPEGFVAE